MANIIVKIEKEQIEIDKKVFMKLLDLSPIKGYVSYKNTIKTNEIKLLDLKELAQKAFVPYPLFFAPRDKVEKQIKDQDSNLFDKLPTKTEMQVGFRGNMNKGDIELIIKDLARKQEFLKKRILTAETDNNFIGSISKMIKNSTNDHDIAEKVKGYFNIDLLKMRKLSKEKIVDYLCKKIESKNILVSLSSYNYMPQNIDRDLGLSGLCVKDKKFPYIFINTRDGDDNPLIFETDGRKIFTIILMLICIGTNKFILNTKNGKQKDKTIKRVLSITGEFLLPYRDLVKYTINNISELKQYATFFKVTPSMLLFRLEETKLIDKMRTSSFREELINELESIKFTPRQPTQVNGYGKYNGEKLSHHVVEAHKAGKISFDEVKNILFRKGKVESGLIQEYTKKYA
jgi:Zn-dependent peptidase ImmA (M78 family)